MNCQKPTNCFLWLQYRPQWVAWRFMERNGKMTKPPVNPHTGKDADVSDPTTWAIWREARGRQLEDKLPGLGIVLTAADGLVGIDLDDCIDPAGNVAPWAMEIVQTVDSYTEYSPSGAGLHILAWGALPPGKRRAGRIEMYETQRYLTFTAHVLGGRWALYERSSELEAVHTRYLAAQPAAQRAPAQATAASIDDLAILDKAFRSRAAPRIARLWTGDTSDYASPSEADLALASYLAFYTQDPGQVRRLVKMSGLGAREKWQRDDYALATVQRAIATRAGSYDPAWKGA
jgi:primase-polymerase (primpol)-like protein